MRFVGLTVSLLCSVVMAVSPVGRAHANLANGTADAVWGQPDFTSGGCNVYATSAASLCHPIRSVTDSQGNLWVSDWFNNRVIVYLYDRSLGRASLAAGRVFGQYGSFSTRGCNQPSPVSPDGAPLPTNSTLCRPDGIAVDRTGTLYVADQANDRVLVFVRALNKNHGAAADLVLGQSDFLSTAANDTPAGQTQGLTCPPALPASACSLSSPEGISLDAWGDLLVADTGNNRVLLWTASTLGSLQPKECSIQCYIPAVRVWGQMGSFASNCANMGADQLAGCRYDLPADPTASSLYGPEMAVADSLGDLVVADTFNNRALRYDRALFSGRQEASQVYGQGGSFTSGVPNLGGVTADSLWGPQGLALDGSGALWIADTENNRVLQFAAPLAAPSVGPVSARAVLGQGGLFTGSAPSAGPNGLDFPSDISFDARGNAYVTDHGDNDRVLEYLNG
jgi:sugar lactone lactonase YvrE